MNTNFELRKPSNIVKFRSIKTSPKFSVEAEKLVLGAKFTDLSITQHEVHRAAFVAQDWKIVATYQITVECGENVDYITLGHARFYFPSNAPNDKGGKVDQVWNLRNCNGTNIISHNVLK